MIFQRCQKALLWSKGLRVKACCDLLILFQLLAQHLVVMATVTMAAIIMAAVGHKKLTPHHTNQQFRY